MHTIDVTLPEELLLIALDPKTGRTSGRTRFLRHGVAGAALAELELTGHVTGDDGRIKVRKAPPPTDPLLSWALESVASAKGGRGDRGPRAQSWIRASGRELSERAFQRLIERGAIRQEEHRVLGLFPRRRHPAQAGNDWSTPVRERLLKAVRTGKPDGRSRLLAALVSACRQAYPLCPGFGARTERSVMRGCVREEWTAHAVHRAVRTDQASENSNGG